MVNELIHQLIQVEVKMSTLTAIWQMNDRKMLVENLRVACQARVPGARVNR